MIEKSPKNKLKEFWEKYETKIVLILGFILVAVISFEGGVLKGQKMPQNPLIIEKPVETQASKNLPEAQNLTQETSKVASDSNAQENCAYVASKNSNKYHLPSCRYAKNINPENRICFSSPDEAQSKGYQADKNCIK